MSKILVGMSPAGAITFCSLAYPGGISDSESIRNHNQIVANKRIHVERAMKRIKAFSSMQRRIPITQFDVLSHLVFVVCFLSNLQVPLTESDH